MNKNESKYFNTARLMNTALVEILKKKKYEFITVKEICIKAGVNRSTFYLHYETMDDLLVETLEFLISERDKKFQDKDSLKLNNIESAPLESLVFIKDEYVIPYLEFVKENKNVFLAIDNQPSVFKMNDTFNEMYESIFSPILARYGVSEGDRYYIMKFYLSGLYAIINSWVKGGFKEENEHIASIIMNVVLPYVKKEI